MFTIPNAVSMARLLVVPYFWYVLVVEDRVRLAAVLVLVIGATDWVDGYLARRLDQVSEFGKLLDPLADRLMIAAALIGGLITGVLPSPFAWLLIAREILVLGGALVLAIAGPRRIEVRWLGKVATFLLYGAIPSFYFHAAGFLPWLSGPIAWNLGVAGLILYWYVAFQYLAVVVGRSRPLESPATP
ncbi:MAG: CDP-alcohol phosphatidyltransferase family protein [Actinomycetota bacterium]